jgi:hypothetical protein
MPTKKRASSKRGAKKNKGYQWEDWTGERIKDMSRWGEYIIAKLLGGVAEPETYGCDVCVPSSGLAIEVKVCSNRDGIRLKEEQFDHQLELLAAGSPYPLWWYAFIKYRNSKRQRRIFQRLVRNRTDVPGFLQDNIISISLFDIRVVEAIRRQQGRQTTLWQENGSVDAVSIGWKWIETFRNNPQASLSAINLVPSEYYMLSSTRALIVKGERFEFDLTAVVHRQTAANLVICL